jgi:tRNA(Ile)-lysidine synthase TilS/MesJ
MKFGRGAGLQGMSGIAESLDKPASYLADHTIIRPMLSITRQDTEDICSHFNLPWIVDQTNLDDNYTRNNIRKNIIPLLKEIYPNISRNAYNFAKISASANTLVSQTAYKELMFHRNSCPGNWEQVRTDALGLQEDIVIYRWIQNACQSCCNGQPVDFDRINNKMAEDVFQAIKKKKTKIFYWSTRAIEVNPDMVTVRTLNPQERQERQEGFRKPKP